MHVDSLCFQQRLEIIFLNSEDQRDIESKEWICNIPHSTLSLSSQYMEHFVDEFHLCAELAIRTSCQTRLVAKPSTSFQGSKVKGRGDFGHPSESNHSA